MVNWEEIRLRHGPQMWSIAWRILKHESDALDCCQDVFAEALERSRETSMHPIENWGGYLSWLTTRRSIDQLRKRKLASQPFLLGDQDVLQIDQSHAVKTDLEFAELVNWVRAQLSEMNGQMAECFWLCCVDEMSYADVAYQLGISTNHVGVNIHRAREWLKTRFAEQSLRQNTAK